MGRLAPKLNTGYANVARNITWYLSRTHDIYYVAWAHSEPQELYNNNPRFHLIPPLPNDPMSTNTVLEVVEEVQPDYLFTVQDYFLWNNLLPKLSKDLKKVSYSILDGPYAAKCFERNIKQITQPVVATKYAQDQLKSIGVEAPIIPHGVNTSKFVVKDKDVCKDEFNFRKLFVYGSVNKNIWRKNYPALLQAFSMVKEVHPDTVLFLVTNPLDNAGSHLEQYCNLFGLTMSSDLTFMPDVYVHPGYVNHMVNLSNEELVTAYNAMDVFVSATMGEGWGLTLGEAQSCGIPAIMPNNSSNTELVEGHGWLYNSAKYSNGMPALIHSTFMATSYYLEVPDVYDLAQKMIDAYEHQDKLTEYSLKCREFMKQFDWRKVCTLWDGIFK